MVLLSAVLVAVLLVVLALAGGLGGRLPGRVPAGHPGLRRHRPAHERGGAPPAAEIRGGEGPHDLHGPVPGVLRRLRPGGSGGGQWLHPPPRPRRGWWPPSPACWPSCPWAASSSPTSSPRPSTPKRSSDMWGLAYKDLLLMRRSLWYYAFLLVIFTVFVLTGSLDAYILSGMAMLFSYMVPLSSFSLDEAARWGGVRRRHPGLPSGNRGRQVPVLPADSGRGRRRRGPADLPVRRPGAAGRPSGRGTPVLPVLHPGWPLAMEAVLLPILLRFGSKTGGYALLAVTLPVFGGMLVLWLLERKGPAGPAQPDPRHGRRPGLGGRRSVRAGLCPFLAHRPAELRQEGAVGRGLLDAPPRRAPEMPGASGMPRPTPGSPASTSPANRKRPRGLSPPGALCVYWGSSMTQLRSSYQW